MSMSLAFPVSLLQGSSAFAAECTPTTATSGAYSYYLFNNPAAASASATANSCTWTIPAGVSQIDYLVVGGGGGGSTRHSGGGGAGGLVKASAVSVANIVSLAIGVGGGGVGGADIGGNGSNNGASGANSTLAIGVNAGGTFSAQTAYGGGYGSNNTSGNGGSSGGSYAGPIGTAVAGQGNIGATGNQGGSSVWDSGGGGGAGAPGTAGNLTGGGKGGNGSTWVAELTPSLATTLGLSSSLTVSGSVYFAGGGGGGSTTLSAGAGGDGGGGAGGAGNQNGTSAISNSGSGGGGSGLNGGNSNIGGNGGSGIVIIRFTGATASSTISFAGGNLVYRQLKTISAVASVAGKVTFKIAGKVLPKCKNINANAGNSYTATCAYKPSTHGNIIVTATLVPTSGAYNQSTSISSVYTVQNRSTPR